MRYFVDVDVALKLASCGFLPKIRSIMGLSEDLKFARLASLPSRAKKLSGEAAIDLTNFCQENPVLDSASDLDRYQELIDSGMDPGEALLFAEAEAVGGVVITGDKRALASYSKCSNEYQRSRVKIVCWEMLLIRIEELEGYEILSIGCCGAIKCDKLLGLAFSSGRETSREHSIECFHSYLRGIRTHSGDILYEFG